MAGKANRARLKVGSENVCVIVFTQSTDQIFINAQRVPGSVLDTVRLRKKHQNSYIIEGKGDSHLETFRYEEREYGTRSG